MEGSLVDALKQLTDHDLVEDVRGGIGLLAAVSSDRIWSRTTPRWGRASAPRHVRRASSSARWWAARSPISPPLILEESQLQEVVDGIRAGLDAVA